MKKQTKKVVKAWAVIRRRLVAWGTPVTTDDENANVWQYPTFPTRKEAKSFILQKDYGEKLNIVPCTITYNL
jgi:hypothetical protein